MKSTKKSIQQGSVNWVLGYARVSTKDQNLAMQIDALERYGCNHIFTEKLSATSKKRPELAKLWRELRPGDTLAVWRLDRLCRNAREMHNRMYELADRKVRFVSLTESIDTSSAAGKFMLSVLAAVAEMERNLTSERTSAGIKRLQRNGSAPEAWTQKFDREDMRKALLKGESPDDYAKRHGVSRSAVYKAMDDTLRRKLAMIKDKINPNRRGRRFDLKKR